MNPNPPNKWNQFKLLVLTPLLDDIRIWGPTLATILVFVFGVVWWALAALGVF